MSKPFCSQCGLALLRSSEGEIVRDQLTDVPLHELSGKTCADQLPPVQPSPTVAQYVAGFAMNPNGYVVLVEKTHPPYLTGKLNAVGGKIEEDETPLEAMQREFHEETGVLVLPWRKFCELRCSPPGMGTSVVHFFYSWQSMETLSRAHTMEDEKIVCIPDYVIWNSSHVMPNLPWLLKMAVSFSFDERASWFTVTEHYI